MLHLLKDIKGLSLQSAGQQVGHVTDILFDDLAFTVRYLVIKTGGWLSGREVLIAPAAISGVHPEGAMLETTLSKEQIENSPPLVVNPPVARQYEELLHDYYSWTPYWGAAMVPSFGLFEAPPSSPRAEWVSLSEAARSQLERLNKGDPHLQSANDVEGYNLHASDGDVGEVKDFLVDIKDWQIRYLVVETGHWFASRKVVVARTWIRNIDWAAEDIGVALTRADIEHTPPYDPQAFGATYESDLTIYYKNLFDRWLEKLSHITSDLEDKTRSSEDTSTTEATQLKLLSKSASKNGQRRISDIMKQPVTVVKPDATLQEACIKMRDRDIGFLPVCDGERIQGAITDRDIVTRGVARGCDSRETFVKDIMTQDIVYIFDDQEILEAARLMEVKQLRRLAVLNRDRKLVGVLSLGDVSTRSKDQLLASEVLKRVSEPTGQIAN